MTEILWRIVAWVVSRRPIADAIIRYAQREPYTFLYGYMNRWWVFNPWNDYTHTSRYSWAKFHIRVHHILRADMDDDDHNHPWWFRTIVLRNWYTHHRSRFPATSARFGPIKQTRFETLGRGSTVKLTPDEFHSIRRMPPEGVWTLIITGPKVQSWGFQTRRGFVQHRDYKSRKVEVRD